MVKRKADKSLEEWLGESVVVSEHNQTEVVIPKEKRALPPSPTAEVVQSGVIVDLVVVTSADVAKTEEETSRWFWELLEQCGYEHW